MRNRENQTRERQKKKKKEKRKEDKVNAKSLTVGPICNFNYKNAIE